MINFGKDYNPTNSERNEVCTEYHKWARAKNGRKKCVRCGTRKQISKAEEKADDVS